MKKKNNRPKWFYILPVVFMLISLPRLVNLISQYRKINYYKSQVELLDKENIILKEQIDKIREDPFYTEKILREKYNYIGRGEYIYIMEKQ